MSRARVGLGVGAATGLAAAGVLLLSMAAAGAGPADYLVVIGGTATPVAPVTASPSAGQPLVFVNSGGAPYVLTRTATPFTLATTIAPSSSSTPFTVPTADGSYPYTAQRRAVGLLGQAGPTLAAQVLVSPPSSPTPAAPEPTAGATTTSAVPTPVATDTPGRRTGAPSKPRRSSSSRASASVSATATATAIQPGGLLPQPAEPSLVSDGVPVPLPVLPSAAPTMSATPSAPPSADAGGEPSVPVVTAPPSPLAVGPFAADAPRTGPRRSRGLPIALALALLIGVGGAVVRTFRRTR